MPDGNKRLIAGLDRVYLFSETAVYAAVALALILGALALMASAASTFAMTVGDSAVKAATTMLGSLLLVFVFVELLGAVRATMRERRLIAEPFLLVGIIATIKEIVVITGAEREKHPAFDEFRDRMVEVGVLSAVVLILAISALLLRRREREPEESDS